MSDHWYSIIEYARTFNISDMTIRRRIRTGKLQAVLREGKYYIPAPQNSSVATPKPLPSPPEIQARPLKDEDENKSLIDQNLRLIQEKWELKARALEAELRSKDLMISQLNQTIDDLKLLLSLIEKKAE